MDTACHPTSDTTRLLNAEEAASSVAGGYTDGRLEAGLGARQAAPVYPAGSYGQAYPVEAQRMDRPTYVVGMNGQNYIPSAQVPVQFYQPQQLPQPLIYGQVSPSSNMKFQFHGISSIRSQTI
jgi:hypothetical protein